jgi:hypothetical protein
VSKKRREGSNPSFCATRRKHRMLAACFFCHLQDQQQAQGHQQLFIRALPEEEEEDGQQQQVPGIHTAQVKLVQQMPEQAARKVVYARKRQLTQAIIRKKRGTTPPANQDRGQSDYNTALEV